MPPFPCLTHRAHVMRSLLRVIATRQSALALWQAEYVKAELQRHHPQLCIELVPMTSRGDVLLDVPLAKSGRQRLVRKELEQALLDNSADIAVHSMKDVPMEFPGLGLRSSVSVKTPRCVCFQPVRLPGRFTRWLHCRHSSLRRQNNCWPPARP